MNIAAVLIPALLAATTVRAALPPGEWVDLTHPFDEKTIYWPTEKGFSLEKGFEGLTEKGYYYSAHKFSSAEHGGTHMDAPIHFAKGRLSADQVPLDRLIGEAVVVDVSAACDNNADYEIQTTDFMAWEQRHGAIAPKSIVLIRTGFGRLWPDRKKYLGTDALGPEAVPQLHFPGLSPNAAKWLIDHRKIRSVGIDTASIDTGQSTLFKTHITLLEKNVPVFENVANMDDLPPRGLAVVALPMKIKGGSGAPLRLAALLPPPPP